MLPTVPARLVGVALVAMLAWPAPARADTAGPTEPGETIVGILELATDGVSDTVASQIEQAIEKELADAGFQVAPRVRLQALLAQSSYAAGCTFGPCLAELHRNTEVRLVLVGRVTAVGPNYTLVMSLLDTRLGRTTSQIVERCDVCTVDQAITTINLAVIGLVTGSGGAEVDPALGPVSRENLPDLQARISERDQRLATRRRRLRRAGFFFLSAAVLAGGAATYLLITDQERGGYPAAGAGAAFAVASGTFLVLSRKF